MTPLKIFIPLDGSKLAEASLSYLSALRALGEVHPMLFSVVDELEQIATLDVQESMRREHNLLSTYLTEVAAEIEKHLGLGCDTLLSYGKPAEQILNAVEDFKADLVLITTHGRTGASRWRLGSIADKVIRGVHCNLMVLGPKAAETAEWFAEVTEPFKNILLPLDGSDLAEDAIPVAERYADRFRSTLHLVRAISVPIYGDISGDVAYPDLMDVIEQNAAHYVDAIAARPGMPAEVRRKVLIGPAAAELQGYIEDNHVDLVVMTTHGRGGFSRAAFGSVTDRLLGAGAPILVVKPARRAS